MGSEKNGKRLLISLLCGVVVPFLYSIIVGPLSRDIQSYSLRAILYAPIGWPLFLLYVLFPLRSLLAANDTALFLYIVGCNVLLYTFLTYGFLSVRARRRETKTEPPPPPVFGD
jgi:hypothetical protein